MLQARTNHQPIARADDLPLTSPIMLLNWLKSEFSNQYSQNKLCRGKLKKIYVTATVSYYR